MIVSSITMLSFFLRERTNIAEYSPSVPGTSRHPAGGDLIRSGTSLVRSVTLSPAIVHGHHLMIDVPKCRVKIVLGRIFPGFPASPPGFPRRNGPGAMQGARFRGIIVHITLRRKRLRHELIAAQHAGGVIVPLPKIRPLRLFVT